MNLYVYVRGDPVNFVDSTGLGPNDPPKSEPGDIVITAKQTTEILINSAVLVNDSVRYTGEAVGFSLQYTGYAVAKPISMVTRTKAPKLPHLPKNPPKYKAVSLEVRQQQVQRWYSEEKAKAVGQAYENAKTPEKSYIKR
jgi:hypothetical protein